MMILKMKRESIVEVKRERRRKNLALERLVRAIERRMKVRIRSIDLEMIHIEGMSI